MDDLLRSPRERDGLMRTDDLPYSDASMGRDATQGDQTELQKKQLKTGTTTVGLETADGVILAADRRASLGGMVSSKNVVKIEEIHPTAATTFAGGVSAAQNLLKNVRAEVRLYETRRGKDMSMEALSTLMSNLLRSGAFFIAVPLLGGVDSEGPRLVSYDALGGITEEPYSVTGSGSQFALGVLEGAYEEGLSLEAGRDAAIDAVSAAVERDTASGNGMAIATITEDGVEIEEFDSMDAVPSTE